MNPRHVSTDITSYGGDAQIVATRAEIDRVMAELHGLTVWLRDQVWFTSFEPLPEIRMAIELPPILEKLEHIRNACGRAADAYFGTEAEISRELRENDPLPIQNIATGFAGIGAAFGLLSETPVTAEIIGFANGAVPPNSIGELAKRLNNVAELGPGWIRIEKFREPASPVSGIGHSPASALCCVHPRYAGVAAKNRHKPAGSNLRFKRNFKNRLRR